MLVVLTILVFSVCLFAQEPSYEPVAEWNGPHYHVVNGTGEYGQLKVDDPVVDSPFLNPSAVAVWYDGTNYISLVVDAFNSRIQFFETDISKMVETISVFSNPPGAGEYYTAEIEASEDNLVPGSEKITVGGIVYTRVDDIAGYSADDYVYSMNYSTGEAILPANSLEDGDNPEIEYAYSSDPAPGVGDIDYSKASANPAGGAVAVQAFSITELVPNTVNRPLSFEHLTSIAVNMNTDPDGDVIDLYVLDEGDSTDKLFTYQVEDDASTLEWASTYDGPLFNPRDAAAAESGVNGLFECSEGDGLINFDPGSPQIDTVLILNNALVTNHTFYIIIEEINSVEDTLDGAKLIIIDYTTGTQLDIWQPAGIRDSTFAIPGICVKIDADSFFTDSDTAVISYDAGHQAKINDYIFVCDTGNDRIKVIKGADNGEAATNGTDSDFFAGSERTDCYWISDGITSSKSFVSACRAEENSFKFFTKDTSYTEWERVDDFSSSTSGSNHYIYDYDTQVIMLGDGVFGAVPNAGDTALAVYNESIDVIDYGSTGIDEEQFNSPAGIAARYNTTQGWYDVYVADTGNNRLVKLEFYPGSSVNPASMVWVTSWGYASSVSDTLNAPTDLAVGIDGDMKVYLFNCDTGNDRVVVYRDAAAEPTGDGGNDAPIYCSIIGASGTQLGYFSNPVGVSLVNNGEDLDVYVVDSQRGYVQKFTEGLPPSLDVDYSNIAAAGYPPEGSYAFEAMGSSFAHNAPAGSYIQLYYSDSLEAVNPILCSDIPVSPDSSEFLWVFSLSPTGTPVDGSYYLYARLFNSAGTKITEDNSEGGEELIIDSYLSQGLSAFDASDGDRYLYLQNGAEREVQFTIDYPDSIVSVDFSGTFPAGVLEIVSIEEGPAWQSIQNSGTVFAGGWDNEAGTFDISASVLGSYAGLTESGHHIAAIATVLADSEAISDTCRFDYSTFTLSSGGMTDIGGYAVSSPSLRSLDIRTAYLGDIARSDSTSGTVPNMVPSPDGEIGFDDLVVFTMGWNGSGGARDPIADLGPATGSAPDLAADPDGKWDVYDLAAFTQMFSWYLGQDSTGTGLCGIAWANNPSLIGTQADRTGDEYILSVEIKEVVDLMSAKLVIEYNQSQYDLLAVEEGGFLNSGAEIIFATNEGEGMLEIYISRLSLVQPSVSGSGELAKATFIIGDEAEGIFDIGYEFRDSRGESIDKGRFIFAEGGLPEAFRLCQNYPNPFNPETIIEFELPYSTEVRLKVFNINGQLVCSLINDYLEAGYHRIEWDGGNQDGQALSSGIYFYRIKAGGYSAVKKMILLK
ncbi:MAG: T9SS type A sorting domain-containing protein [candidate division Zixibacteria bacterium]|nr:T9SS type A sorting domain-containing protein [Candidatus Tariuqbacter arcticus]